MSELRTRVKLSRPQRVIFDSKARFKVLVAGRRFGKTFEVHAETLRDFQAPNTNHGYMAPTLSMAKDLMWDPLLGLIPPEFIIHKDTTRMSLRLRNGVKFRAFGAEKFDRARGWGWDRFRFDEMQHIHPDAWKEVVRPALSDRLGHATFYGTPHGKANYLYDLYELAGGKEGYERFHYTTLDGGWVPESEVEAAKDDLDERTFRQEYEASFETSGSTVYYTFDDENIGDFPFMPSVPLSLCWDFNRTDIKPMVCSLVQPINKEPIGSDSAVYALVKEFVHPNTNTDEMCEVVVRYLQETGFNAPLYVTGDYAGKRRESSASHSDYQIIDHHFKNIGQYHKRNPVIKPTRTVQDRVASLNSLFRSMSGIRRMFIDRQQKHTIEDVRRTEWHENGVKLNDDNGKRTDETDAWSYFAMNFHDIGLKKPTTVSRG